MRGLMEKDIRLIFQKKAFLFLIAVIAVVLSFSMDDSFAVSYVTMIGMVLAITTLSYDEYDNGMPFLMTLPVSRKGYAAEKQIFSYLVLSGCWILGMLLQLACSAIRGKMPEPLDFIGSSLLYLGIFVIILAILIPLELHFGMEKSRIAMIVLFGACFAIGMLGSKLGDTLHIDLTPVIRTVQSIPAAVLAAIGAGIVLLFVVISAMITGAIMKKKEF